MYNQGITYFLKGIIFHNHFLCTDIIEWYNLRDFIPKKKIKHGLKNTCEKYHRCKYIFNSLHVGIMSFVELSKH